MKKRARKLSTASMNMTPMIDVVFQLIIFFVFATEIAKIDENVELKLPQIPSAVPDKNPELERLVINIDKRGDYVVGGKSITLKELRKILKVEKAIRAKEGPPILIRADENIEFKKAHIIIYLAGLEKIRKLSFGAAPKEVK